jgi:hypothetical protein
MCQGFGLYHVERYVCLCGEVVVKFYVLGVTGMCPCYNGFLPGFH